MAAAANPYVKHESLLCAVRGALADGGYLAKKKASGLNYAILAEADVLAKFRPILLRHGLFLLPEKQQVISHSSTPLTKADGGQSLVRNAVVKLFWILRHFDTAESITFESLGEGSDYGDKCVPKAVTMAVKTAIRHLFLLVTGHDPDNSGSEKYGKPPDSPPSQPADSTANLPRGKKNEAYQQALSAIAIATSIETLEKYKAAAARRAFTPEEHRQIRDAIKVRTIELTPPEVGPDEPDQNDKSVTGNGESKL